MNEEIFFATLAGLLHELKLELSLKDLSFLNSAPAFEKDIETIVQTITSPNQPEKPLQQLETIFAGVGRGFADYLSDSDWVSPDLERRYLPPHDLTIKEKEAVIFPQAETAVKAKQTALEKLKSDFTGEIGKLKAPQSAVERSVYLHNLLNLMQRFFSRVPSRYYQPANVSLYDHSRMVAAVAACQAFQQDTDALLLVGGDISGVQTFIYTITSAGATSGLRGRSMYLQLLTEVLSRYLLDQLDLPLTNVIYAGGGHFYLLVPQTAKQTIRQAQRYISRVLLQHHQGDLYLALAEQSIQIDQLRGETLSEQWDSLQKRLQRAKQQPFAEFWSESVEPAETDSDQLNRSAATPYCSTRKNMAAMRRRCARSANGSIPIPNHGRKARPIARVNRRSRII